MIREVLAVSVAAAALAMGGVPLHAQENVAADITVPSIDYTIWSLENGLRVIAIEDKTTANVTTSMWYDVGSKLDPEGRSGFAHLFEHILSRKTLNMPYNQIYSLTADVGGTRNASNGPIAPIISRRFQRNISNACSGPIAKGWPSRWWMRKSSTASARW